MPKTENKRFFNLLKPFILGIVFAGLVSIVVRIVSMIGLLTLYNQPWALDIVQFIPIITSNADNELYITLNGYSLIITAVITFLIFLSLAYKNLSSSFKKVLVCSWCIAMLIPFSQYLLMALTSQTEINYLRNLILPGSVTMVLASLASIITVSRINKRYMQI